MIKITIQRNGDIVTIERANDSLHELIGSYLSSLLVLGYTEIEIENHVSDAMQLIKQNQEKDEPRNKNVMSLGL
jgi:hypothetical protein